VDPAVEQQAIGRVHRIGQARPVTVFRLITADTVEARAPRAHVIFFEAGRAGARRTPGQGGPVTLARAVRGPRAAAAGRVGVGQGRVGSPKRVAHGGRGRGAPLQAQGAAQARRAPGSGLPGCLGMGMLPAPRRARPRQEEVVREAASRHALFGSPARVVRAEAVTDAQARPGYRCMCLCTAQTPMRCLVAIARFHAIGSGTHGAGRAQVRRLLDGALRGRAPAPAPAEQDSRQRTGAGVS